MDAIPGLRDGLFFSEVRFWGVIKKAGQRPAWIRDEDAFRPF